MNRHNPFLKDVANTPGAEAVRGALQILMRAIVGIFLVWGVLTKSLPFVFAETDPELSLRLNPDNPIALIALAERERAKLLQLTQAQEGLAKTPETTNSHSKTGTDAAAVPAPANAGQNTALAEINERRDEIVALARRAIANDPLNARGFRILAEVSDTPEQTRLLMKEAVKRSRRESIAVFWLLADSFAQKDFLDVVENAEVLLRTGSDLTPEAMSYLGELAAIPEGRAALVAALAQQPSWRSGFFQALPNIVQLAGTPYELMIALKDAGSDLAASELAPYLNALVRENLVPYARDIWVQLRPEGDSQPATLLNNASFASEPSGMPFDWGVQRGTSATVEFTPLGDKERSRSVSFTFGAGRVQFPELSQMVVLAPGRYRFSGEFRGMIRARRGLRWEIHCWKGKELAKTEMLYGLPNAQRQPFGLDIDVPDRDDCRSQHLRLFHDARSASEQLISGQASFRSLGLTALAPSP
jgi:hypothetical protein